MTRFKRTKAAIATLKLLYVAIRSVWMVQKNQEAIDELTEEMVDCEDCEHGFPCEKHQQVLNGLMGEME